MNAGTPPPDRGPGPDLPLAGRRVVEMGQLIAGPFCGQILGDFGAEIIKVEDPRRGDPMRGWGPAAADGGSSLWWPIIGRNKKSVTLDLRTAAGQDVARRLISEADVLIENFRPGTMEAWGLDYESLSAINPGLVMVRVSGFGQSGPYSHRAGFGSIAEAMGGLRYVSGDPDRPPSRSGISLGDELAGLTAAMGALVALLARERDGRGQVVDCAIYESVLAFMESLVPEYVLGGFVRERSGAILPGVAPSNIYATGDGQSVLIAANADAIFGRLAQAMGSPELATDERFRDHQARGRHQAVLDGLIDDWTRTQPSDALLDSLEHHAIPAGKIYRAEEMVSDPQFRARQSLVTVPDDHFGDFPMQNVVPRLSETPGAVRWTGPRLGEHNDEVLQGGLGLSAAEVATAQGHTSEEAPR
ncbi:CaiB/BaiF CoA transferase family protein [Oryzobacter telluris]|uniref:CaiB/BaiF CoA transferase family protein n=1 Tax=Oryzobacter telluris TaxID=3149179 RepID=UPI00370D8C7E